MIIFYQELMKVMGVKGWLYWASWYFKFSLFILDYVTLMTVFFHIKVVGERAVVSYGDPTVTFVFLLLFALSLMTFCFAISTFFSNGLFTVP